MTILKDVFKTLWKMLVADFRLTVATLGSVVLVAVLLKYALVSPRLAGGLLLALCIAVLVESILRETRLRRANK